MPTTSKTKNWRDKSHGPKERFDLFMADRPGAREHDADWLEIRAAYFEAEMAAAEKRLDDVMKINSAEAKDNEEDDHERIVTLRHDLVTGKVATITTVRQFGHRIIIDASSVSSTEEAYRGFGGLLSDLRQKLIASADVVSILGRDELPSWVTSEDYSDHCHRGLHLIIILPGKSDRAHFSRMHGRAHLLVATAWLKADKPALFIMDSPDRTTILNTARECELSDARGAGDPCPECWPDAVLRIFAAARPACIKDYGRAALDYAGVLDGARHIIIKGSHSKFLMVMSTIKAVLDMADTIDIIFDLRVQVNMRSGATIYIDELPNNDWNVFLRGWLSRKSGRKTEGAHDAKS
jgi:hypothetical protein